MNPWWRHSEQRVARAYPYRREVQRAVAERMWRLDDRRALVLLGPRQVGKTTALLQTVDDLLDAGWPPANVLYFDFSDDRITRPPSPRDVVDLEPAGFAPDHPRALLLDEVGSAESWDRWLKQAVDRGRDRIVVTDSAAALVRRGGRESGVGRWDELRVEGLLLDEFLALAGPELEPNAVLERKPDLVGTYLELGGFPENARSAGALDSPDLARILGRLREAVVERAILRDLAREVRDPRPARSLFVFLMQESGGIWNAAARANDLGADPRSVDQWRGLLEETMLVAALPRLAAKPAAGLRSRPKLYAADHGLVRAFAAAAGDPGIRGRLFEAVVFRHLRELTQREPGRSLSYYRDRKGLEADFVLEGGGDRIVVEVTASRRLKGEKLERLRAAADRAGADRTLLVYDGTVAEESDGITLVPLVRFLLDLQEIVG